MSDKDYPGNESFTLSNFLTFPGFQCFQCQRTPSLMQLVGPSQFCWIRAKLIACYSALRFGKRGFTSPSAKCNPFLSEIITRHSTGNYILIQEFHCEMAILHTFPNKVQDGLALHRG